MKLIKLLQNIDYELLKGNIDTDVLDITYNSKTANQDNCFIALVGIDHDGHDFIKEALNNGCRTFIIARDIKLDNTDVTIIKVKDTRKILPIISSNLFLHPQDKLIKIAVTGTKGKTTVSYMLKKILSTYGLSVGVIGTNGTFYKDKMIEHKNTTPESYLIEKYMHEMVSENIKYLIMEVSSQSLKVGRVSNIVFDYAIFTNISNDHVGPREHPTKEDYILSKAKLFKQSKIGLINKDDPEYKNIYKNATSKIITYGSTGDYKINNIKSNITSNKIGMNFNINDTSYYVGIPGIFSVYNASSAIVLSKLLNIPDNIINKALYDIDIPGRMEIIKTNTKYKIIIDYAHNDLSISSILNTMHNYFNNIVTVLGCGGGRSKDIRIGIGKTAGKYSDFTIITSDNPRNDNLDEINRDIELGVKSENGKYIIIKSRKDAIAYAIESIPDKDLILLLGKGHEKYEEVQGKKIPFDERQIVKDILKEHENE